MEGDDDGEGKEGGEAAMEEARAPGDDDDGAVGKGDDGGDKEDHEVAEDLEARAEAEGVGAAAAVHAHCGDLGIPPTRVQQQP